MKTDKQEILELRHGRPIRELVISALEKHQGGKFHLAYSALELDITPNTLRNWASRMGIDLNEYGPGDDQMEQGPVPAGAGKP